MAGLLLRSGRLRDYNALGAVGRPVHTAATQLRTQVRRLLGPDYADMLAVPQINEAGDTVDWYGPDDGMVVPWSAATEDERAPARQTLQQARLEFQRRGGEILAQSRGNQDMEVFARLLPLAAEIPDESHIHLVNGRPVLTFWGFTGLNAPPDTSIIRDLAAVPAAVARPAISPAAPALAVATVPWWRRWWWLLPLLLFLLLLTVFGLRGCGIPVLDGLPGLPPLPATPDAGVTPVIPDQKNQEPGVTGPGVVVPGIVVPGKVVPGDGGTVAVPDRAGTTEDGRDPGGMLKPDQLGKDQLGKDQLGKDQNGKDDKTKPDSKADKTATPPQLGKDKDKANTPPTVPLTLPDQALSKDGAATFLDGRWQSHTGLMDSQTGRPVEMEYNLKNGKGEVSIRRSDGVQCTGPVDATVKGKTLVLDQSSGPRCADGQVFDKSKVECRPGKDGKAECRGVNADGSGYHVQIVK